MTKFYLVRHGKTEFNQQGRFQGGDVDSPLLPESIKNAQKVGSYLSNIKFSHAFCSPQNRAVETAKNIIMNLRTNVELTISPNLREMRFGKWDGDVVKKYITDPIFNTFMNNPENYKSNGGEDYYEFVQRIQNGLEGIFQQYSKKDDNVLIAAHALVISFATKTLTGEKFNDIRREGLVDNTSVTILSTNDFSEFQLEEWNKTDFLYL